MKDTSLPNRSILNLVLIVLAPLYIACSGQSAAVDAATKQPTKDSSEVVVSASAKAAIGNWGINLADMTDMKPGNDFFRYLHGTWLDTFEMPADKSRYGIFIALRDTADDNVKAIIEDLAAKGLPVNTIEGKVGAFYNSWMNTERIEQLSLTPLQSYLNEIAAIGTTSDLMAAFGTLHHQAPISIGISPDPADTTKSIIWMGQDGLGLPDRDYYLNTEQRYQTYRSAYAEFIGTIIGAVHKLEEPAASIRAQAIIELETAIAQTHWRKTDSRDISKVYNPMDMQALATLAPDYDWQALFSGVGLGDTKQLIVAETTAIADSGKLIKQFPLNVWQDYLTFHLVRQNATYLPRQFDEASFKFYGNTLQGTEQQRDRWKRGVALTNANLGEAVGQVYVQRHFPPKAKQEMDKLIANLVAALESRIKTLDWMDEPTRQAALVKLSSFEPRIGYPSKWRDYSDLTIAADDLLGNVMRSRHFSWQLEIAKLGQPVNREEWAMNPQTVNAYYNPLMNQITFPAAILQPPFFDPDADAAVNYGAIGAVIGHEIGHGFDDQGRKFDETGKIRDWWTETASNKFNERTAKLAQQYDAFCPLDNTCVNGELTMGENIGDLGGLQMAYTAYQHSLAGKQAPSLDGYSPTQRFFLSWAQVWQSMSREDALRQQLVTDPHSPPRYRVNGVVRNMDQWYQAFEVSPDDSLYLKPEERVKIW